MKVRKVLAGIEHARHTDQVTLFADAVALDWFQVFGIDYIRAYRMRNVRLDGPVTPITGDSEVPEWRFAVLVHRARNCME